MVSGRVELTDSLLSLAGRRASRLLAGGGGGGGGGGGTAPTLTLLTEGEDETATAPATASVAPTAGALLLLYCFSTHATNVAQPTVTGVATSWDLVTDARSDPTSPRAAFLFRAQDASYSSGTVTMNFGTGHSDSIWILLEASDTIDDTAGNGAGCLAGFVSRGAADNATTTRAKFLDTQDDLNELLFFGLVGTSQAAVTPETGWTELAEAGSAGTFTCYAHHRSAGDGDLISVPTWTGSASWNHVTLEVAGSGTDTSVLPLSWRKVSDSVGGGSGTSIGVTGVQTVNTSDPLYLVTLSRRGSTTEADTEPTSITDDIGSLTWTKIQSETVIDGGNSWGIYIYEGTGTNTGTGGGGTITVNWAGVNQASRSGICFQGVGASGWVNNLANADGTGTTPTASYGSAMGAASGAIGCAFSKVNFTSNEAAEEPGDIMRNKYSSDKALLEPTSGKGAVFFRRGPGTAITANLSSSSLFMICGVEVGTA